MARRAILSCGLGRFASTDPNATAHFGPDAGAVSRQMLATSLEKADAAGFDVVVVDGNPQDHDDTLRRIVEALKSRDDFVGVNVGYGLRGHKEHTELFEKILNTVWQTQPGIKIIFSNGPDHVFAAIQRNFPQDL